MNLSKASKRYSVTIDSGPISANDPLRRVPREKWHDLMLARRQFMEIKLTYDCRCLLEFVADAHLMYETLGFPDVEAMIRDGYKLVPEEIDIAVEWLRLNPIDEFDDVLAEIADLQKALKSDQAENTMKKPY